MSTSGLRKLLNIEGDTVEKEENPAAQSERSNLRNAGVRLVRQETVVLLVDLVESVRLMQEHEVYTVAAGLNSSASSTPKSCHATVA